VLDHPALVNLFEFVQDDVRDVRVQVVQVEMDRMVHQLTVEANEEIPGLVSKGIAFGHDPVHHQFEDGPQAVAGIAEGPSQLVQDHEPALKTYS
jgi:hypothetical protein